MKIDLTNLNWNQATVLDSRYIYYLALMLNERTYKIGVTPFVYTSNTTPTETYCNFTLLHYSPCGMFRYQQLYSIYAWTLWIGHYIYMNRENFSTSNFYHHSMRKLFGYVNEDFNEIADFDFNAHPLVPNQPLNYYDQFLKPLYLLLKEFKYMWCNSWQSKDGSDVKYYKSGTLNLPTIEVNNLQQTLDGPDSLTYRSLNNLKTTETSNTMNNNQTNYILGMNATALYRKKYWYGYYTSKQSGSSWVRDHREKRYAENYEGPTWESYTTFYKSKIRTTIPIVSDMPYELYLYSITNDRYLYGGYNAMNNFYFKSPWPDIISQGTGTISNTFPVFDIELPSKYGLENDYFDDLPVSAFEYNLSQNYYETTVYNGGDYDHDFWNQIGTTPTQDWDGNPLTPGVILRRKGNRSGRCTIGYFYKPMLIVDYSSFFQYN